MSGEQIKWGVVSTIKAHAGDILTFAAHYLEAGAHRLFLYLDAPCPDAFPHLKAHPKIRVTECNETYWRRMGRRPVKHQVRQSANASRAYQRQAGDVDWLLHCDVDEFLWSAGSVAARLAALPPVIRCARVRPVEALAGGGGTAFKGYLPVADQDARAARLYPQFGKHLKGGFLSHVQGKLFTRTGIDGLEIRIHNVLLDGGMNPGQAELDGMDLCHFHAADWQSWISHYRYRLQKGSYRAGLAPSRSRDTGGITAHELLSTIETDHGEAGLRVFFDEVCADSPDLRNRLQAEGLLKIRKLDLDTKRRKHFPEFG
ncbi:glycosyltransferase family 2 protein [Leisingera sp. MMG026]|uniref:glycosyltransferase family 2 protein n=1 Tax=Leisingera sp. MMG026 TaxID=2909982 RepID=UPI001F181A62|nr:glycosyltransferase family 2 protein [Leisingera sp. MMG026]MCF6430081.1 glycosyltransferase family 2 protein [Leisingera sp. MMG026]